MAWHNAGEGHFINRVGWLRAAVLGANDGIVSTASLIVGVASAAADKQTILLAGAAGLVAGAMSMAAGEYVSVSSQSDTEAADRRREAWELRADPDAELDELTAIYQERGLDKHLARQVAEQLTRHNALQAHMRDELGITDVSTARPIQAALTSALTFAIGAALPLAMAAAANIAIVIPAVGVATILSLALLGALGAKAGGANMVRGGVRVTFWGLLAMVATAAIGSVFGVAV